METSQLDHILKLQLAIAWAGESKKLDPPRLGWWQTTMCDQFGGEDLLRRIAPRTAQWAALETCRAAAMKIDEAARRASDDADHLVSLYRFGFEVDERLNERLLELKQSEVLPTDKFPDLAELSSGWSKQRLQSWLEQYGRSEYTATTTGRRLRTEMPEDPASAASQLVAALLPLPDSYPLPHFRMKR